MRTIELSIIIVNWHSADYVLACIRSIYEQTSVISYEVIVVDNASLDGCGERLACEYPDVIFLQSQRNLGFGLANNLGAIHARGPVLLFLNPDTVVQDRAIERLYAHLRALPDAGVVGCRVVNSDGLLQTSCVQALPTVLNQVLDADVLRRWFPKSGLWGNAVLFDGGAVPVKVEAVSGTCMMIHKEVFDRVGGFSSDFFMYGEDLDLSFKTWRAGFPNYYLGKAVIVHHGGGSSRQTHRNFPIVMMLESVYRFFRKNRGCFYSSCYRLTMSGAAVIRLVLIGVLFPIWLARRRTYRWCVAFQKWIAILRWGLGLERWTRQYEQSELGAPCSNNGEVKSCVESVES